MQDKIYLEILEANSLSNTRSRKALFGILSHSHEPLTLPELVRRASDSMNKTTVYRTVEAFKNAGIVKRISLGWKESYELSDAFSHHHHHMTCNVCGNIIPFEESFKLLAEIERIEEAYRFIVDDHTIELRGRCHKCQMKSR